MPGTGPNPATVAASVIQAGKGVYDLFDGIKKNREAKKILRNEKDPVYNRQEEVDQVAELAVSEMGNTQVADGYARQANQGLSQGIDAVLKSGGKADFNTIYNSYGNSMESALQQIQRERSSRIASANSALYNKAKAKDTEFQYNIDAPHKNRLRLAAQLKKEGAQGVASAFTNVAGAVANFGTANLKPGDNPTAAAAAAAAAPALAAPALANFAPPSQIDAPDFIDSFAGPELDEDSLAAWTRSRNGRL